MSKQLHKNFNDCQVKDLLARYLQKKIERKNLQKILGIKRASGLNPSNWTHLEKNKTCYIIK